MITLRSAYDCTVLEPAIDSHGHNECIIYNTVVERVSCIRGESHAFGFANQKRKMSVSTLNPLMRNELMYSLILYLRPEVR